MALEDHEYTSFITSPNTYCHRVMLFGLKNARGTYQRIVNKIFKYQIGKNVEAYVDDMIMRSKIAYLYLIGLAEIFQILKKFNMYLNLTKCTFRVNSGKFLRFIVH